MMHAGKLIHFGESVSIRSCCDLVHSGCNVKSLSALVRKELTNCSTVLTLNRPRSFLPLKMAASYPAFPPTIHFTFSYAR